MGCHWVRQNSESRCARYACECPVSCDACDLPCTDAPTDEPTVECVDDSSFTDKNGETRECDLILSKPKNRCEFYSEFCPVTCDTCPPCTDAPTAPTDDKDLSL